MRRLMWTGLALAIAMGLSAASRLGAQTKLTADDPEGYAQFGSAVSRDGDTIVVGAPRAQLTKDGAVYVFQRNAGGADGWGQVAILTAGDMVGNDWFGLSVAACGDTAVVGAPFNSWAGAGVNRGAAYVFERNQGGADTWGLVTKLSAEDNHEDDFFGYSVAISGGQILVGAHGGNGTYQGAAYLFERDRGGVSRWGQLTKITADDSTPSDEFGRCVALDGDTALIGAYGSGPAGDYAGSAYVFARNQGGSNRWGQVAKLAAPDGAEGDCFGLKVALAGDTAVAGAYFDDVYGEKSGSAYVFARNQGGADAWGLVAKLSAADGAAQDEFGSSVAAACGLVVVGAHNHDSVATNAGAAYVFARNQGGPDAWGQVAKLTAGDGAQADHFGACVAMDGPGVVVGSPFDDHSSRTDVGSAYRFDVDCGSTGQRPKLLAPDRAKDDWFGYSVSVSGDTLVVGAGRDAHSSANQGSAYLFRRNAGGGDAWLLVRKVTSADVAQNDFFGMAVSLSGDTLVVGALGDDNRGSAYLFRRNAGGADAWGQVATVRGAGTGAGDFFGCAVEVDGDTLVVGARQNDEAAPFAGAAYVFERNATGADAWGEVAKLMAADAEGTNNFGMSVALWRDRVVVGAPNNRQAGPEAGAAYIFERQAGGPDAWGQVAKLTAADAVGDEWFGYGVAIDRDTVAVGSAYDDLGGLQNAGSVFVFQRNRGGAGAWGQVAKLTAGDPSYSGYFGTSVAMAHDQILVGAPRHGDAGPDSGAAYVFERNQGGPDAWGQVAKLTALDGAADDHFGSSVAMGCGLLAVGAGLDDEGPKDCGSAYLFGGSRMMRPHIVIRQCAGQGTGITFNWIGQEDWNYQVQSCPALGASPAWTDLPGYLSTPGRNGVMPCTDASPGAAARVYQVTAEQQD